MHALTWHGPGTVRYEPVRDPRLEATTDALVAIELAAICGSDLHVYHGQEVGLDPGTVMGHEFVGEVLEVGVEVHTLRKGDLVFSPFTTCCGRCFYCLRGLTSRCTEGRLFGWVEKGVGLPGGQAEHVRVPLADSTLLRIPEGVGPGEALLLGDNLSTGVFCAQMAEVAAGGTYAVIGCGAVGLAAVIGALERDASLVFAIDRIPERLARATELGAVTLDLRAGDPVSPIREGTEGRGVDGVLEAAGGSEAARLALELVRPGGAIAAVGVHTESAFPFPPAAIYDKNLTYRAGRCPARRYMKELIPLVRAHKYPIGRLLSHHFPLSEGPEAYRLFAERRDGCIKVSLGPS